MSQAKVQELIKQHGKARSDSERNRIVREAYALDPEGKYHDSAYLELRRFITARL